jgi:tetratricopeptide (TPR) repeat protein
MKWQEASSLNHQKIGEMYQQNGETQKVLNAYEDSSIIRQGLLDREPNKEEWQRGLSQHHQKTGDIYRQKGENNRALHGYEDLLIINQNLCL